MITTLLWLIVVLILLAVCYWAVTQFPLPPMIKTVVTVLLVVIGVIFIIKILMGAVGGPPGW